MKDKNWYKIHWLDGTYEFSSGESEVEACNNACICSGAIRAIDYIEKVTELPIEHKEMYLRTDVVNDSEKEKIFLEKVSNETIFHHFVVEKLRNNETDFHISLFVGIDKHVIVDEISEFLIIVHLEKNKEEVNYGK